MHKHREETLKLILGVMLAATTFTTATASATSVKVVFGILEALARIRLNWQSGHRHNHPKP